MCVYLYTDDLSNEHFGSCYWTLEREHRSLAYEYVISRYGVNVYPFLTNHHVYVLGSCSLYQGLVIGTKSLEFRINLISWVAYVANGKMDVIIYTCTLSAKTNK